MSQQVAAAEDRGGPKGASRKHVSTRVVYTDLVFPGLTFNRDDLDREDDLEDVVPTRNSKSARLLLGMSRSITYAFAYLENTKRSQPRASSLRGQNRKAKANGASSNDGEYQDEGEMEEEGEEGEGEEGEEEEEDGGGDYFEDLVGLDDGALRRTLEADVRSHLLFSDLS